MLEYRRNNFIQHGLPLQTTSKDNQKLISAKYSSENKIKYTSTFLNNYNKIKNKYSEKIFAGYSNEELKKTRFMGHAIANVEPNHPYVYINIYINKIEKYKAMLKLPVINTEFFKNFIFTSQIINYVIEKIQTNLNNLLKTNDKINIRFIDTLCSVGFDLKTGKYVVPVGTPYSTKIKMNGGKTNKTNKMNGGKHNKMNGGKHNKTNKMNGGKPNKTNKNEYKKK